MDERNTMEAEPTMQETAPETGGTGTAASAPETGGTGTDTASTPETADGGGEYAPISGDGQFGDGSWADDAILPEGWTGEAPYPATEADPLGLGPEETALPGFGEMPEDTDTAAPEPSTAAEPAETPDAGTQDTEPDYKALYQAEMDRQNAEKYRNRVRELTEQDGMPLSVAELAAENEFGKRYPLDDPDSGADAGSDPDSGGERGEGRPDFAGELKRLAAVYPDLREMPSDVMAAYGRGESLTEAYAGYRARQDAATIADLRAQLDAANQHLANVARAPVTPVSTGGAKQEPDDPFLTGFNAD